MTETQEITFDDTAIAFRSKSDKALKRMHLLFRVINNPWLVKIGTTLSIWAMNLRLPVKGLIKATVYKQFVGGESVYDCEEAIDDLGASGIKTILDYSVEGQGDEAGFEMTKQEMFRIIEITKTARFIPFCVMKLTGLGSFAMMEKIQAGEELGEEEKQAFDRFKERVLDICQKVSDIDSRLLIDAEESWIQNVIDDITYEMMEKFNKKRPVIYNTYQMYRNDMYANLVEAHRQATEKGYYLGAKLVRGAYMEKERARAEEMGYPSPINATKADSDADFNKGIEFCVQNIKTTGLVAGTHNENSSGMLASLMNQHGLSANDERIFFAQLYGMSDNISYILAEKGFNVAKYVPYGPVRKVMPYLSRRADENTSIAGQSSREFKLITTEIKRRKTINNSK